MRDLCINLNPVGSRDAPQALAEALAICGAGNFLAYENTVEPFIAEYAKGYRVRKGRNMTDLHKHLVGAAYQLASFRDAVAIAR